MNKILLVDEIDETPIREACAKMNIAVDVLAVSAKEACFSIGELYENLQHFSNNYNHLKLLDEIRTRIEIYKKVRIIKAMANRKRRNLKPIIR